MRTTKTVCISLPPVEPRTLGKLADEYTPAQRRAIGADIAASMTFKRGCFLGPFDKAKKARRPAR